MENGPSKKLELSVHSSLFDKLQPDSYFHIWSNNKFSEFIAVPSKCWLLVSEMGQMRKEFIHEHYLTSLQVYFLVHDTEMKAL